MHPCCCYQERNLRDEIESRHQGDIGQMVAGKERMKELQFELNYVREQLSKEAERVKQLQEQV